MHSLVSGWRYLSHVGGGEGRIRTLEVVYLVEGVAGEGAAFNDAVHSNHQRYLWHRILNCVV